MKPPQLQLNHPPSPHSGRASLSVLLALCLCVGARAQVNSGSTGADGAFNPTTNTVINMADHPDGIYHYTSVNIPSGVTVIFTPNANNTPVVWLVQSNCVINGTIDISGSNPTNGVGGLGGPGGGQGGVGGSNPSPGRGLGGGKIDPSRNLLGGNASFGSVGDWRTNFFPQHPPGDTYANKFLVPLAGGSGGGGGSNNAEGGAQGNGGGGGGGGAILIAASSKIEFNGAITAYGGSSGDNNSRGGGGGSGGGVRLVASTIQGSGYIHCHGGNSVTFYGGTILNLAGNGRIRFDCFQNDFGGSVVGVFTQGYQPVILPVASSVPQLAIASVAGNAVTANPSGQFATPDVIIPGQQSSPVNIVVRCTNLPLNTPVTVTVRPASGNPVSAVGYNNVGTLASSTATVSLTVPRGGGTVFATAATGN